MSTDAAKTKRPGPGQAGFADHNASNKDLPAPRPNRKGLQSVSAPLYHARLDTIIYFLCFGAVAVLGIYAYGFTRSAKEAGGYINLALGRTVNPNLSTPTATGWRGKKEQGPGANTVEAKLEELALALGMPAGSIAEAVAAAVKEQVPPASLTSIAAQATGEAVKILVGAQEGEQPGYVSAVADGIGSVIGMDEPPELM